jgi:CheY-like chemotaxis protein
MNNFHKHVSICLAVALVAAAAKLADAQTTRTRTPRNSPAPKAAPKTVKPVVPKRAVTPKPPAPKPEPKADDTPAPKPAEPAAAPPPTPPTKQDAAKQGAAGPATPEELASKTETNPAVLNALQTPRKTPRDYLQAILWLVDLGRPELARPIMAELVKLQITDQQRIELVTEFGSSSMLKLARAKELAPAGAAFSDACMAAASTANDNPQRLTTLISQLADPSAEVRAVAQHDLAVIGQPAAKATLETFARATDARHRAALADAILTMRPFVEGPLLAMLDTSDPALRSDVARLLVELKVPRAQPFLVGPANSERELAAALHSYAQGTPVAIPDAANQVELWQWNDANKQLTAARLPADEARIVWMSKLARALAQLRPENGDYQQRALVLAWEAASLKPATAGAQQAATADVHVLNGVLAEALNENAPHAAIDAINALAPKGNPSVLITGDGKPSPLADAVASPNRSVRFAALRAIMALDPTSPYPGSSRVPEALAWFAGSADTRRAIVAMPTNAASSNLAGLLAGQNLSAEATNRGRDAVNMAVHTPDLEAIFVDMDILVPGIRDVLYELRTNATTGEVPIALLAAEGRLEAAKRLAAEHRHVVAVPRPHSPEVVASTLKQLVDMAGRDSLPPDERVAQATQAQSWLAKLETGSRPFYVIRRTALLPTPAPRSTPPAPLPNR